MTYNEYRQLRLYARYDGFYASILLLGSFACFLALSLTEEKSGTWMLLTSLCPLIVLFTPLFLYHRLCKFRDEGLKGNIQFQRALIYGIRTTTNAAFFFSLVQYVYMRIAGNGQLVHIIERMLISDRQNTEAALKSMGMTISNYIEQLHAITPLALACNSFIMLAFGGIILSVLFAVLIKKTNTRNLI